MYMGRQKSYCASRVVSVLAKLSLSWFLHLQGGVPDIRGNFERETGYFRPGEFAVHFKCATLTASNTEIAKAKFAAIALHCWMRQSGFSWGIS
jgi:hypothetical protein